MSRGFGWIVILVIVAGLAGCGSVSPSNAEEDQATVIYVSLEGSDHWSGTLPAANPARDDGPVRSLQRARDIVRTLIANQTSDIHVVLREGTYHLENTLVLSVADSPKAGCRIIYRNYKDEQPVISSGRVITNWEKCPDPPAGIAESARDHVWVADIDPDLPRFYTLYAAHGRLPRARCNGFKPVLGPKDPNRSNSTLHYPDGTVMRNWPNIEDVEIVIRPWCLWTMNILPLARVDERAQIAYTALEGTYPLTRERHGRFGEQSVWVENVPEALDRPGEWFSNSREGKIYYWPRGGRPEKDIVIPTLCELIRIEGDELNERPVRGIVFNGLTLKHGRRETWAEDDKGLQHDWEMYDKGNALMRFRWAENCEVTNCTFTHSGGGGLRLDLYAQQIEIQHNEFSYLGGTGLLLCGYGPGGMDVNKNNIIRHNHIHHIGQIYWHCSGLHLWQSGSNRIAHNRIHHTPYNAVTISGVDPFYFQADWHDKRELSRTIDWQGCGLTPGDYGWDAILPFLYGHDNLMEYNEIHHAMEVLGDGNGLYIRMCPAGNIARRNYFHHILGQYTAGAIRMDDQQFGCEITENIIYHCTVAGICTKHANTINNNFIIDILTDNDPRNTNNSQFRGYIVYYPSGGTPEGTPDISTGVITQNILYHTGDEKPNFYIDSSNWSTKQVYIEDQQVDRNLMFWKGHLEASNELLSSYQAKGIDPNSIAADPQFADLSDFALKDTSPAFKLGIKPIHFNNAEIAK